MINLTTKLKAYPRLEPSILSNYYTKEQTNQAIDASLESYVKDVENPVDGVIYGRSLIDGKMEWINILGIDSPVIFKVSNNDGSGAFPTATDLESFALAELTVDPKTFNIRTPIETTGFLWVCSTKTINQLQYVAGDLLHVDEPITFIRDVEVPVDSANPSSLSLTFHCYRTNVKYVASSQATSWIVKVN